MSFLEVLLVAVGLAMDAFAVALAAGGSGRAAGSRAAFRLSFHFGLFQFLMPIVGWSAGTIVAARIEQYDHWVAFGLLTFIGLRMIRSGFDSSGTSRPDDPSRGVSLVMLSLATSIDALAVGLSMAMLRVSVWYPSAVIGVFAATLTLVGLRIGSRLGALLGKRMEIIGGIVLLGIGTRILLGHLRVV